MNLSFSTRGWPNLTWEEMLDTALDMGFTGVEVYNLPKFDPLTDRSGPFNQYQTAATVRQLHEKKLKIPCFDTSYDLSDGTTSVAWLKGLMEVAQNSRVPYVAACALQENEPQVRENLEGKRFSVLILSGPGDGRESLLILRDLKWTLDRKYGTDESSRRIIAAASAADERLNRMAQAYGWDCFEIPAGCGGSFGVLSAAGLLVMEAAGLDASAMWQGAAEAQKELDLRSFENPVWLYAAVRNLMLRCGKTMELVSAWEPGFSSFGAWWRQLFLEGEGRGLIPVSALLPGDNHLLERMLQGQRENFLETMVQFTPVEDSCIISLDANNLDELNHLSDRMLSDLEEETCLQTLDHRVDQGIGMIALECGALEERTVGQLICFLELSCAVSAYTLGVCPWEKTEEAQEEEG